MRETSAFNIKEALALEAEGKFAYQAFWGHNGQGPGPWALSQWWPVHFSMGSYDFTSAEMAMMAAKAVTFNDTESLSKILAASSPKEVKALGRGVKNFDQGVWEQKRYQIVVKTNLAKFSQHPDLKEYLLSTAGRTLIEASPYDKIWGVGLSISDSAVSSPSRWKGLNLLGFALTETRHLLSV